MANKIERLNSVTPAYVATASASTSPRIPFGAAASGAVVVTAVSGSPTKISWHAALEPEGTAYPIKSGGSAVETTIASGEAYPIPDALAGASYIVAVVDAGTATVRLSVKG